MERGTLKTGGAAWFGPYAKIRAESYAMLAWLLSRAPTAGLMKILAELRWEAGLPEKLDTAFCLLRWAGGDYPLAGAEEEFNRLFVGLGCGEMMPYASWYREKRIQSLPLAHVRADLVRLGILRQQESREAEDHAGALCEVMSLLTRSSDADLAEQAEFFHRHLHPWMRTFFHDLQSAAQADFYHAVGFFGGCLMKCEDEYLRGTNEIYSRKEGGSHHEQRTFEQPAGLS